MADWLILVAVGVGTYLMRFAFLISHRAAPPASVRRALPHIGPAVLGAMVVPALLLPGGTMSLAVVAPALVAAVACALVWWRTGSTPLALVAGLVTAWVGTAVLSL
ncbi:MAG TPA: AzlD domain-containing protein [Micromonosporaceae bacterium]